MMSKFNRTLKEIYVETDEATFLTSCYFDLSFWAEKVFGFEIKPHHAEMLNIARVKRNAAIMAHRGSGKSEMLGIVYPLWLSWFKPGSHMIIISGSEEQAIKLLDRIKTHINTNELLNRLVPEGSDKSRWNKTELYLPNGSKIYCKPYNDRIRGEHVDYVLLDEAGTFDDPDIFKNAISPTVKSKKGTLIAIGTPTNQTDLLAQLLRNKWYFPKVYKAINDNGESIWPERFSLEELSQIREEIGDAAFKREYLCDPMAEGGNTVFPPKILGECYDFDRKFTTEKTDRDGVFYIGCMLPNSLINTSSGLKYVEEVLPSDKLLTHKGEYKEIDGFSKKEFNGKVYEIKPFYQPHKIKVTDEHPFLIHHKTKGTVWRRASELKKDDNLAIPIKSIKNKTYFKKGIPYLIGKWLADGWLSQNRICICFGKDDKIEIVENILKENNINYYKRERASTYEISFNDGFLFNIINNFGKLAHGKFIPDLIYNWDKESILDFINGYLDGDGCIHYNKKKNELIINFVSVSLSLLLGLQRLLASLGLISRISLMRKSKKMLIENREVECRDTYQLFISTKNSLELLSLLQRADPGIKSTKKSKGFIEGSYLFVPIQTLNERDYSGPVYNFDVRYDHSYCEQNIITHNCDFAISTGPRADYDVYTIVEKVKDFAIIKYAWRQRGVPIIAKVRKIKELAEQYNPERIFIDDSNIGAAVAEELRAHGIPFEGVSFHPKSRNNMIVNLKQLVDAKRIIIPFDNTHQETMNYTENLVIEMTNMNEVKTKMGTTSYQCSSEHDDCLMSLALAVRGIYKMRKMNTHIAFA